MAHANAMAALDFARQISTASGPSQAVELWSTYTRKQFETLTDQSKELAALGQKIATSSAEPITRSLAQTMRELAKSLGSSPAQAGLLRRFTEEVNARPVAHRRCDSHRLQRNVSWMHSSVARRE